MDAIGKRPPLLPAEALRRVAPPKLCCALVRTAQRVWVATAAGLGRVEEEVAAMTHQRGVPAAPLASPRVATDRARVRFLRPVDMALIGPLRARPYRPVT